MHLFDLSLKFNGFDIKKAKRLLANIQAISEADFNDYIVQKRKAILEYHLANNPLYKNLAKDIDVNDWNSVPIMTKRDLQQPLKNRLSNGFNERNCYVNKTSGSSGDPFIFAKDKWSHAISWAVIQNRYGWFNIDFNSSKQARFYGIPLDKKGNFKERIKDFFGNRLRFSVFDLSDVAFEKVLNTFRNTSFDYINGYTSPIVQFAKYLEKNGVFLKSACPTLKACIVTAEMLFDEDKALLESQFGIPVINEYGASELEVIAFQNRKDEWQVNSEALFVEILDENDQPLNYGKEGRIIITSLYNKAHPFIRYDIGDIGVLSPESTLKRPILKKLIGRTNDIAILPSGKKAAGLTFYYITKTLIEDDGNVKEFVIVQEQKDQFKIMYSSQEELTEDKKKIITKEMEHYLEDGIHIYFERKTEIERTTSGKLKQFTSLVKDQSQ